MKEFLTFILFVSIAGIAGASEGTQQVHIHRENQASVAYQNLDNNKAPKTNEVLASIAQLGEPLAAITGGCVRTQSLLGSGADPHLYRLTRADVLKVHQANNIYYVGHHLEVQMRTLLQEISHRKPVYAMGELIDGGDLMKVDSYNYDPHLWMDPVLWNKVITDATLSIVKQYPECATRIMSNLYNYQSRLASLHNEINKLISSVSPRDRILVSSHDAFGYFGKRYGVKVVAIQGISTDRQISVRRISRLVDFIVDNDIKVVFTESSVNPRDMQAVVAGARNRGHELRIAGTLYSDAMGESGTEEGTYIGMLKYNARTIVEGWGVPIQEDSPLIAGKLASDL